jgi:hypothetical protein
MKKVELNVPNSGFDPQPRWGVAGVPSHTILALTMLVPTDWTFGGQPEFVQTGDCNFTAGRIAFAAMSPDKMSGLLAKPAYTSIWSSDRGVLQMTQQANQQYGKMRLCKIEQPQPLSAKLPAMAKDWIQGVQVTGPVEPIPGLGARLDAVVDQANRQFDQQARQSGRQPSHITVEAGRIPVKGAEPNGTMSQGYVYAMQVVRTDTMPNGATLDTVDVPLLASCYAPEGQLARLLPMYDAMFDSVNITPEWQQYAATYQAARMQIYQGMLGSIANSQMAMAQDNARAAANQQSIRQGAQQDRAQVLSSVASDRAAALDHSAQQFSMHMGDQAIYKDPATGQRVQMSSQYDHAWASATGNTNEYILTDSPSYNPNGQAGSGSWTQMQQER